MTTRSEPRHHFGLIAAFAVVVSCAAEPWALRVANDSGTDLVVRVITGGFERSWLVADGGQALLLYEQAAVVGELELIDPRTCEVYDRAAVPETPTLVDPGDLDADPPDFELGLVLGPTDFGLAAPPNFDGC